MKLFNRILAILLICIFIFTGCSSSSNTIVTAKYDKSNIKIGTVDKDGIMIDLPEKASEEALEISVAEAEAKEFPKDQLTQLSGPIEILANESHVRFDEPVMVALKVDVEKLKRDDEELSEVRVGYFDGENWVLIRPESIDGDKGIVKFRTYHFSPYLAVKANEKALINEWIANKAVEKFNTAKDEYVNEVAGQALDLALKKLNITDKSISGKIIKSLRNDSEWGDMVKQYNKKDVMGFNQSLQVLIGKKIAENVGASTLKSALESVTDEAGIGWIKSGSEAAGYMAEGRYKDAARIIGEKISDDLLITKAGKMATETIQAQIDSWKDSEIEAAYKAYRDGANNYFFGYNVDAKDFDAVWLQMRGIRRQLELEAIRIANENREEIGFPPLDNQEMEKIREKVKADYRKKFKNRVENEEKIKKEKQQLALLIKAFNDQKFLGRNTRLKPLQGKGYTMEQQLDILHHFAKKFMKDTKSSVLTEKIAVKNGEIISADYVSAAAREYFNKGKDAYNKYLFDKFGISMYPEMKALEGSWTVTSTVKEAYAPPATDEDDVTQGCDAKVGDVKHGTATLTALSGNLMNFTMTGHISGDPQKFKYQNGIFYFVPDRRGSNEGISSWKYQYVVKEKNEDEYYLEGILAMHATNGAKLVVEIVMER